MESIKLENDSGRRYQVRLEEVAGVTPQLIRTLIEIDLQTFSEPTFSQYTGAFFLRFSSAFLLRADELIIGTCVLIRSWDRPQEALILAMGIRPGWRGRGLGQRFVDWVIGRLRARGVRAVSLLLSAGNRRALKVYTEVGFAVSEELPADPLTGEAMLVLRKQLLTEPPLTELTLPR